MDPLSILASVTALATATFQVVSFLGTMKEGGNDRLRITTEVNSLWMLLKQLEGQLEPANHHEEAWLRGLQSLYTSNGIFDQISEAINRLHARLKPQTGHRKVLQTLRWPLTDKKDVEETVGNLERLKSSISLVLNNASLAVSRKVNDAFMTQKTRTVTDWLTSLNFLVRQQTIIRDRSKGTGAWFLESEVYMSWKATDDSILWCPGIPGAGKTFLASTVVENLREEFNERNVGIFMIYCNYNDAETQSVQTLIASLVKQDIQGRFAVDKKLEELHEAHYKKETHPTIEELKELFESALAQYEKTFIVLDALDEMLDEKNRTDLVDCLRTFRHKTNLLLTSRPIPSIRQIFGASEHVYCDGYPATQLKIYRHCMECAGTSFDVCEECHGRAITCRLPGHGLNKCFTSLYLEIAAADQDLRAYIMQRISNSKSLRQCVTKKPGLDDEIVFKVTEFANGMFLLAKFHMDSLATKLRPASILNALKSLPTEIDRTYDQAMERIENMHSDHRDAAKCFLSFVAYTDRALTVGEIEHATATYLMCEDGGDTSDIDPDDIISAEVLSSMCAGLVVVEDEKTLLVHYTAVNYFDQSREKWFPDGRAKIAKTCLTYLTFDVFELGACTGESEDIQFEHRHHDFPLLGYASLWWGRFSRQTEDTELTELALTFLESRSHVEASVQALWYTDTTDALTWDAKTGATGLHLAAYFGLDTILGQLLEATDDLNIQDSLGTTALIYAVLEGHYDIVRQLLAAGASATIACHNGSNALHLAATYGRADVTKILLENSDLNINAVDPSQRSQSALMLACKYGNVEIIRQLLQRDDLLLNLNSGNTALMFAAMYGQLEATNVLLADARLAINDRNDDGATALMLAALNGQAPVVEALLDDGADPEITDSFEEGGGTPLLRAIDNDEISVVRLLLKHKVDWMSKDKFNRTIIHGAAINGRHRILRLLLEQTHDLDVNAQDRNGRVALHDSAWFGYTECIKVLLEFGARTDIKNAWDQSPLKVAKETDHPEAYRLLLDAREGEIGPLKRAETDLSFNELPLWVAARLGKRTLVDAIIETARVDASIKLEAVDPTINRTALHYAAVNGHTSIIKKLLAAGLSVNRQDQYGRTSLQLAAMEGNVQTVRALLVHDALVSIKDQWCKTALDSAKCYGHYKIAVILLQHGATISANDNDLFATLCAAAAYGNSEVVMKLINAGAEPQHKDEFGMTPFQTAKQAGHERTAQVILEYTNGERSRADSPIEDRRDLSVPPSVGDESEEEGDDESDRPEFSSEEEGEESSKEIE